MLIHRTRSSFSFIVAALTASIFACASASAETKPLTIGTDGAYPPYNATTSAGTLVGFEIDLVDDLCKRMNRTCKFVTVDWTGLIPKLQEGTVDIVMSAMSVLPERKKVIDFTVPYFKAPTYFVAKKGNAAAYDEPSRVVDLDHPTPEDRAALKRLEEHLRVAAIGTEGATTHEALVRSYFPNAKRINVYSKQENLFLDLSIGRVDAAVVGYVNVSRFINEEHAKGREFVMFGPGLRGGVLGRGVAFGIRKGNDELRRNMNRAIVEAAKAGTIRDLSQKWFQIDGSVQYGAGEESQ